jgi:AsmA protein
MAADALVVDSSDTNITGSGNINLRDETLALTLVPLPKNPGILSLRAPLHVSGTFSSPEIRLDKPMVSLRAGSAALLALVNPLAALLPLIETGPGKDSDCAGLMAALARAAASGSPPSR